MFFPKPLACVQTTLCSLARAMCYMPTCFEAYMELAFLCRTIPMRPDQLTNVAKQHGNGVTVFRREQLPVRPGLSEGELHEMLQAHSVYM